MTPAEEDEFCEIANGRLNYQSNTDQTREIRAWVAAPRCALSFQMLWRSLPAIAPRFHIKGSGVANSLSARTGQKTTNKYRDLVMVPIVDGPDQRRTYTIARLYNCSRRYIPPLAL